MASGERKDEGETLTYIQGELSWIAAAEFKGSRMFYRKAILACGGRITKTSGDGPEIPVGEKRRVVAAMAIDEAVVCLSSATEKMESQVPSERLPDYRRAVERLQIAEKKTVS